MPRAVVESSIPKGVLEKARCIVVDRNGKEEQPGRLKRVLASSLASKFQFKRLSLKHVSIDWGIVPQDAKQARLLQKASAGLLASFWNTPRYAQALKSVETKVRSGLLEPHAAIKLFYYLGHDLIRGFQDNALNRMAGGEETYGQRFDKMFGKLWATNPEQVPAIRHSSMLGFDPFPSYHRLLTAHGEHAVLELPKLKK